MRIAVRRSLPVALACFKFSWVLCLLFLSISAKASIISLVWEEIGGLNNAWPLAPGVQRVDFSPIRIEQFVGIQTEEGRYWAQGETLGRNFSLVLFARIDGAFVQIATLPIDGPVDTFASLNEFQLSPGAMNGGTMDAITLTSTNSSLGRYMNLNEGNGTTFFFDSVPEPATTALLALGLLGAGYARRRHTH